MAIKLLPSQKTFARRLAAETGLNTKVIQAWMLAEMGGATSSPARSREAARNYNWLNIAYFDSGPGGITKDKVWRTPEGAAKATAQFLKGEKYGASSGIRKILRTRGQDPQAQINAIATSGWATSGYNGGSSLRTLFSQVEGLTGLTETRTGPIKPSKVKATGTGGDNFEEALVSSLMKGGKNPLLRAISAAENGPQSSPIPEPKKPGNYDVPSAPSRSSGARGSVSLLAGAERPGQRTQPGTLRVARMIAGVYGKPLKIGTTTQHNRLTTTGNISDHWDGWGADIPSAGQALTRLGQSALIALGMPEAKARKIKGGAHTLKYGKNRRVQVIFNTNIGGNHYNHLHVGVSPV